MRSRSLLGVVLAATLFGVVLHAQTGPVVSSGSVFNAASLGGDPTNVAAPGSIISIFGQGLATSTASAGGFPLPAVIGTTAVLLGDEFIPLLFVSPNQINAQIPFEASTDGASLTVWVSGRPSASVTVTIRRTAPGIFTANSSGVGPAIVAAANGRVINSTNPAQVGQEIQVLATGLGVTVGGGGPSLATGGPASDQATVFVPTVTIGGQSAVVISSRAASGQVGQYWVRMIVPDLPIGDHVIAITSDGRTSRAATTVRVGLSETSSPISPVIFPGQILNGASLALSPDKTAAPGSIVTIFGTNLAIGTAAGGISRELLGTTVSIGNIDAPLLLVSPGQINAQVPFELQPGSSVAVVVRSPNGASKAESLQIVSAAPGIYSTDGSGAGVPLTFHASGVPVGDNTPALPGEPLSIIVNGMGATLTSATAGPLVTGELGAGQSTIISASVTMGGQVARVISSIAEPGTIGRYRITAVVPDLVAGSQALVVSAAGKQSQSLALSVGFLFPQPPVFFQANLAGNYLASFGLKVKSPSAASATEEIEEIAFFNQPVAGGGCTIAIAGSTGPTYSGQVHCQDYSNPNNLIAILMSFKDGRFVDNKLVFTTLQSSGVNHLFYIGVGATPTRSLGVTITAPITGGAVSIDLKRPDFSVGDSIVGTIHATFALGESGTIPAQSVQLGGSFVSTLTNVRR